MSPRWTDVSSGSHRPESTAPVRGSRRAARVSGHRPRGVSRVGHRTARRCRAGRHAGV